MNKQEEPKLILCSDWQNLIKEINRQLKSHFLRIKYKTNYKKWGDQIQITVVDTDDILKIYDEFRAS